MSQHHQVFHVYLITSHHVSSCLNMSHQVFLRVIVSHHVSWAAYDVSPCLIMYHHDSSDLVTLSWLIRSHHVSTRFIRFMMSHHVSTCLSMSHHVSSGVTMSHHVSTSSGFSCLITSHHVSSCLNKSHYFSTGFIRFFMSSCLIMSHHVSTRLVMSHHVHVSSRLSVSTCLIMSHRVSSCLNMSHHASSGSPCLIMFQHVSSYLFWSRLSSHPFNRIPAHRIISFVFISHHLIHPFPSFSAVIPLQPREKSYSIA